MVLRTLVAASLLAACSGSTPDTTAPDSEGAPDASGAKQSKGIAIESDIGAMNESEVLATFEKSQGALMSCFQSGAGRLRFLGGKVRFHLRVDQSGAVKSAHLLASTLGDRQTEDCMLGVVRGKSWPAPQGGREGIAETEFAFDPSSDVREPVDWDPADAGKNVPSAKAALGKCRKQASAGAITATLYVDTDGSVMAVGVSGESAATEEAASCVVAAIQAIKFNSPGSYAAKMTLAE